MGSLVDNFDMVVQIKKKPLAQIFQAQHCIGIALHKVVRQFREKRVDLVINSSKITLETTSNGVRARAKYRVFYHSRMLYDEDDVGTGAVADINVRYKLSLSTGNPSLLSNTSFLMDPGETTPNDITVYGVSVDVENEVKDTLMAFLPAIRGEFNIPSIGPTDQRIGYLGFRFLSNNVLAAGMNVGNTVKGSLAGLQTIFVTKDWALAYSADYVLKEINNGLRSAFDNSPPPPLGDSPVRLYNVCTIRVGDSCWNHQIAELSRLVVSLESGSIVFTGRIKVRNTGALIPDFTVNFKVKATAYIGANQSLQVTVGEAEVDIKEWYANVIDTILGGLIKDIVRNSVKSVAQSYQGEVTSFFSSQILSDLASVDSAEHLEITSTAETAQILSEAMIIHGTLSVSDTNAPPIVAFTAIPVEGYPFRWVLDAGASWAPGGTLVEYRWDFPDGQTEITRDTDVRFVTEYRYRPIDVFGSNEICLTVTDDHGRRATNCGPISCTQIDLVDIPTVGRDPTVNDWEVPQIGGVFPIQFQTSCGGVPLSDVLITVVGSDLKMTEYTGKTGRVTFLVDSSAFEPSENTIEFNKLFATGHLLIEASTTGLRGTCHHLWIVRNQDRAAFVNLFKKNIDSLQAQLNALSLRIPPHATSSRDVVAQKLTEKLADLAAALDLEAKLILQIEQGANISPILALLGISSGEPADRLIRNVSKRLEESLSAITRQIDALNEEYSEKKEREGDRNPPSHKNPC